MKNLTKYFLTLAVVCFATSNLSAQNADALVAKLVNKYGEVPAYKVDVEYEVNNDDMGFSNTQNGVLVVRGEQYILKYGPNETWMSDGKTEYVGTKEEDHSQILFFCPGDNTEAIVDYGHLLTFFGTGHSATLVGNQIKLVPNSEKAYTELLISVEGDNITSIKAMDEMGTSHIFRISNFSTSTAGTQFTINQSEYAEKIDERDDRCR